MSPLAGVAGRVVLVTGGNRGLGREMALELAAAGARVAITASRDGPSLAAIAAVAGGLAGRILPLVADVRDAGACALAVAQAEAALGPLEVLVNNAGRGMRLVSEAFTRAPTRFWETTPEAWREIWEVNVTGVFLMTRAAVPGMIGRGFGKVINISTSAATMVRRGYAPYGPSKAALEAASRIFAQDLAGTGVDVNLYLPGGASDTDLLPPGADRRGADGSLLDPAIMRRGIAWLVSDASNGVTGARFVARDWDPSLPPDRAAAGARTMPADVPQIV